MPPVRIDQPVTASTHFLRPVRARSNLLLSQSLLKNERPRIERRGMLKQTRRDSRSGLLASGDWTRRNGARRYGPWRWPKRMIQLNVRLTHSMSPRRLVLPRPPRPSWSRRPSMPRLTKVCCRRSDAAGSRASDVRIAAGMRFVPGARPVASLGIGAPTAARHSIR